MAGMSQQEPLLHRDMQLQPQAQQPFTREGFSDPQSIATFDSLQRHISRKVVREKVLLAAGTTTASVSNTFHRRNHGLTYEQLIQSMMLEGEQIMGSLEFTLMKLTTRAVNDKPESTVIDPAPGRCVVTNQRVMIFNCESYGGTILQMIGDPKKPIPCCGAMDLGGHYNVAAGAKDVVRYRSFPFSDFLSVSMSSNTGVDAVTEVRPHMEEGCCGCNCISLMSLKDWKPVFMPQLIVEEHYIQFALHLPPWGDKTHMQLKVSSGTSLTAMCNFVAMFQGHALFLSTRD